MIKSGRSTLLLALICLTLAVNQLVSADRVEDDADRVLFKAQQPNCPKPNTKFPNARPYRYVESCFLVNFYAFIENNGTYWDFGPGKANTNVSCASNSAGLEKLELDFDGCGSLEMQIVKVNQSTCVRSISGWYSDKTFTFSNSSNLFCVKDAGHSYKCNTGQMIDVGKGQNLIIGDLTIEAFRNTNSTDTYQIPTVCSLDAEPVSDWVRYGVGIGLVALVAIVVIAYFIGRRRWSERSTYESV